MNSTSLTRNSVTVSRKYTEYFFPTVLTAMATNLALIVDSMIAGNLLGRNALAAINLLSPVTQLYFSLTILFGLGASVVLSIAKGKQDEKLANHIFTVTFIALLAVSAILMAVQIPLADVICSLLTKDETLHALLYQYYIPFLIGTPLNLLLLSAMYFIRADARPQFASAIIIIANVVNLIMDYVYMGFMNMGIRGASIATLTGYAVGFVIMSTHFFSRKNSLRFDFSILKKIGSFFRTFADICVVGISGALGTLLITVKMLFLNTIIQNVGGSEGLVAYSVCSSSQVFMSMFITGASQTMIPIIGVCLGEKDYKGVRYAFRQAAKVLGIASIVITLFILAAPEWIIRFFGITTADDIASTIPALRINALSFTGLAFSFLFLYYYMAIQKKAFSTVISVVNGIVILIPSALLLSRFFGITGVWISLVIAQAGTLIVIFFLALAAKKNSNGTYKSFYLLEESDEHEILSLSFQGTKENAVGVSLYLTSFLTAHNIEKKQANKIAVAVEEMAVDLANRMGETKKADIDIRLLLDQGEAIISIRDNGTPYDPATAPRDEQLSSMELIKAVSKKVEYSRVLGFNRTMITI